jgi:AcrR family transcriptional regulator
MSARSGTRSGRRPGESGSRYAILAAARAQFAERGYDRTTIRGIATAAAVDSGLVIYFFRSKDRLFLASIELAVNPAETVPKLLEPGLAGLGERLTRFYLGLWATPETRDAVGGVLRSAFSHEEAAGLLRAFLGHRSRAQQRGFGSDDAFVCLERNRAPAISTAPVRSDSPPTSTSTRKICSGRWRSRAWSRGCRPATTPPASNRSATSRRFESMISIEGTTMRNLKRWRDGKDDRALDRAGMLEAEKRFDRVQETHRSSLIGHPYLSRRTTATPHSSSLSTRGRVRRRRVDFDEVGQGASVSRSRPGLGLPAGR